MPKNKNKIEIETKKDFYYVMLGIFLVVNGLIILGRLGNFGNLLNVFFRILFGDYYFAIFVFIIFLGIKSIITKKIVNFSSIRILGIIVIYISLSIFSSFSIYNGLDSSTKSFYKDSLLLYKRYLNNYQTSFSCGGGLIGGLFFQILILFLGKIGVYLIASVFLGVGVFFVTNLSLISLLKSEKGILRFIKRILYKIRGYLKNIDIPLHKEEKIRVLPDILSEAPKTSNLTIQRDINLDLEKQFLDYCKQKRIIVNLIKNETSYYSSRFVLQKIDIGIEEIKYFFMNKAFVYSDEAYTYITYQNKFKAILSLKELLSFGLKYRFPIGIEINNEVIAWNPLKDNLFIIGDYKNEIDEFLKSIISLLHIDQKGRTSIYFFTDEKVFNELNGLKTTNYFNDLNIVNETLDDIISEYEKREELYRYLNVDNYLDVFNNKNVADFNELFIICRMNFSKVKRSIVDKINFLIKNGQRYGIHLICTINYLADISLIERQNQMSLIFKTTEILMSLKTIANDFACYIGKNGECLALNNKKISQISFGYVTDYDYENILKKFIC